MTATARAVKDTAQSELHLRMLRQMLLIRRFEEKAAEAYALGKIGGFCHLYIGQEAVGVGALAALRDDDYVICSYREHGQALIKGIPANAVMAELFGKATGCSKGKGGSMHLVTGSSAATSPWAPGWRSRASTRAAIRCASASLARPR